MNQLQYSFIVCLITGIASCSANGSSKGKSAATSTTDNFNNYYSLKEKAVTGASGSDTTFLQFRFGMSPDEVKNRLLLLEKDSTIMYDYDHRQYSYDLKTGRTGSLSKVHCLFTPRYYLNELYSIELWALNESIAAPLMVSVLTEKYGSETAKFKLVESSGEVYAWFISHIEIKINELAGGAVLRYTDLKREKLYEKDEQRQSDKAKAKSQSEL